MGSKGREKDGRAHKEEFPSNVRECSRGGLEVDKVGQSDCGDRHRDALSSQVVREEFRVEDDAGAINSAAVEEEEEVAVEEQR